MGSTRIGQAVMRVVLVTTDYHFADLLQGGLQWTGVSCLCLSAEEVCDSDVAIGSGAVLAVDLRTTSPYDVNAIRNLRHYIGRAPGILALGGRSDLTCVMEAGGGTVVAVKTGLIP